MSVFSPHQRVTIRNKPGTWILMDVTGADTFGRHDWQARSEDACEVGVFFETDLTPWVPQVEMTVKKP
jgi:hypothetical protein